MSVLTCSLTVANAASHLYSRDICLIIDGVLMRRSVSNTVHPVAQHFQFLAPVDFAVPAVVVYGPQELLTSMSSELSTLKFVLMNFTAASTLLTSSSCSRCIVSNALFPNWEYADIVRSCESSLNVRYDNSGNETGGFQMPRKR